MLRLNSTLKSWTALRALVLLAKRHKNSKNLFKSYKYNSEERKRLEEALRLLSNKDNQVPLCIGNERIFSGDQQLQRMSHNHKQVLAKFCYSNRQQIKVAIKENKARTKEWRQTSLEDKAKIWQKAADILENDSRYLLNAAIMLGQSKCYRQAETDTCRLIRGLRVRAELAPKISKFVLKNDMPDRYNTSYSLRPLDGFVAAITPFNSVYSSGFLVTNPALMGNCVIWKPSDNSILADFFVYDALEKAGLPKGVITFMPTNSKLFLDSIIKSDALAGINFIGRLKNYRHILSEIALNLKHYRCLPKLSAECGGRNFHFVHDSADTDRVADDTLEAAFSYSGQSCFACSRLYVPTSLWEAIRKNLCDQLGNLKIGDPCDFTSFTSSVIRKKNYDRIVKLIEYAKKNPCTDIVCGGDYCETVGYFIEPTIIECNDPKDRLMAEDYLGPLLTVFTYKSSDLDKALLAAASASNYALSGSIYAQDDEAICTAMRTLRMSASNLYINEKCTGSRYGHAAFGGNRFSSTNDKSMLAANLIKWSAPQMIEEKILDKK